MSAADALDLVAALFAVAVALQSLELWRLRDRLRPGAVWDYAIVRDELPHRWARLLDPVCRYPNVLGTIAIRAGCALALTLHVHPVPATIVILTSLALSWRWRGAVCGGSDAMTLVVAVSLWLASWPSAAGRWPTIALWLLSVQLVLSYWLAGVAKVRSVGWRRGDALQIFLRQAAYRPRGPVGWLIARPQLTRTVGWAIVAFELAFPLILVVPETATGWLIVGAGFHLANVYALGLTRFWWIWLTTYPALYCCAGWLAT